MNKDELWDVFEKSGRVDNYLTYKLAYNKAENGNQTVNSANDGGFDDRADNKTNQLR